MDRFQDLKNKEVIDICDGRRLGFVCDIEVDVCTGCVHAIIVPTGGFFKGGELVICWCDIKKIGDDIILVDSRGKR